MDYSIRWSVKASENLNSICRYIAKDSLFYASLTAKKIINIIEKLPAYPYMGRIVPEYDSQNIREIIYKNYRIVYRIQSDIIEIAAICHCAKNDLNI